MSNEEKKTELSTWGAPLTAGTTLEAGVHDYIIHAIVGLGLVQSNFKNKDGTDKAPSAMIKVIFELPDEVFKDKDGNDSTRTVSVDITHSPSDNGNWKLLVSNAMQREVSSSEMVDFQGDGLKQLLGKTGQLTIEHYTKKDGTSGYGVYRKGFVPRRKSAPPMKPATKEPFTFNPYNPDMEAWSKLTPYTKKSIMSAVNANQFPEVLQEAWKTDQENQATENANKENTGEGEKVNGSGTAPWEGDDGSRMAIE